MLTLEVYGKFVTWPEQFADFMMRFYQSHEVTFIVHRDCIHAGWKTTAENNFTARGGNDGKLEYCFPVTHKGSNRKSAKNCKWGGKKMRAKVYHGTIESLLKNEAFLSEFLQGIRRMDLSRLIDDGIFAKLFIADAYHTELYSNAIVTGEDDCKAALL